MLYIKITCINNKICKTKIRISRKEGILLRAKNKKKKKKEKKNKQHKIATKIKQNKQTKNCMYLSIL